LTQAPERVRLAVEAYKICGVNYVFEPTRHDPGRRHPRKKRVADDETRFLKSWIERPLLTGAVMPSGKFLAKAMAAQVDLREPGPIVEIGPGTGPVTEALIARGVPQERLVLVEFNPDFIELLRKRFPLARVIQGDAYRIAELLKDKLAEPAAAVVSSLPLFTKPPQQRRDFLDQAFTLMSRKAPFIQFTYAVVPPIPERGTGYTSTASNWILLNIPPARVWVYRKI
jgi:phosphatidylethanolamine/phosphatidyl-N-methylethanolamine N-methyltransferase